MENDVLQINNYEMEDLSGYLNGVENETTTINEDGQKEFTPLVEANLFGDGMKAIGDKMDRISQKLNAVEKVILNNTNAIAVLESKLKEEASSIQIPTGYEVLNVGATSAFNKETLTKNDGTSVNEGILGTEAALQMEENVTKENLKDISGNVTEGRNLNFNNVASQENLQNISGNETQREDISFRDVVNQENLNVVNANASLNKEVELDLHVDGNKPQTNEDYLHDDEIHDEAEFMEKEGEQ